MKEPESDVAAVLASAAQMAESATLFMLPSGRTIRRLRDGRFVTMRRSSQRYEVFRGLVEAARAALGIDDPRRSVSASEAEQEGRGGDPGRQGPARPAATEDEKQCE